MKTNTFSIALLAAPALLIASCAAPGAYAPQQQPLSTSSNNASDRSVRLSPEVAKIALADNRRLVRVGERILFAGAPLCGSRTVSAIGFRAWNAWSLGTRGRPILRKLFGLTDIITVRAVGDQTPASRAGLKTGDQILAIGGLKTPVGPTSIRDSIRRARALNAAGATYPIAIRRDGANKTLLVAPAARCAYTYSLLGSSIINAGADGVRVYFTRGMMRFVKSDLELAVVFGHEVAHNLLGHAKRRRRSANESVSSAQLYRNRRFSKARELEADYVGLYLVARAGFDITEAPNIWRRMATENPRTAGFSATHPTHKERLVAMQATVQEILAKRARGLPLIPNRRAPRR